MPIVNGFAVEWEADCGHEECTQWLIDAAAEHGDEWALREAICVVAEREEEEAHYRREQWEDAHEGR